MSAPLSDFEGQVALAEPIIKLNEEGTAKTKVRGAPPPLSINPTNQPHHPHHPHHQPHQYPHDRLTRMSCAGTDAGRFGF